MLYVSIILVIKDEYIICSILEYIHVLFDRSRPIVNAC